MNPKIYEFETVIQKVPDIDGAYSDFLYDVKDEFGKGRVKDYCTGTRVIKVLWCGAEK